MKKIKWQKTDKICSSNVNFRKAEIVVKTLNREYLFGVLLRVSYDKKAHEEYSFSIEWSHKDKGQKFTRPATTKNSEKTLSYNKCVSWIFSEIRKIIEVDLIKADKVYNSYVDVMSNLALEQDFYARNQTPEKPICKR